MGFVALHSCDLKILCDKNSVARFIISRYATKQMCYNKNSLQGFKRDAEAYQISNRYLSIQNLTLRTFTDEFERKVLLPACHINLPHPKREYYIFIRRRVDLHTRLVNKLNQRNRRRGTKRIREQIDCGHNSSSAVK